jgi:hypothetical protein
MKYQRGLSLNGLMIGGALFAVVAILGARITPEWIEYGAIDKAVKTTASDPALKESSVAQVRAAYAKRAEIDTIKSIAPDDLDITKDAGELVISYAYTRKIPLFHNVSLVFDFEGSSARK